MPSDIEHITKLEHDIIRLKTAVQELAVLNEIAVSASSSLAVDQVLDIIVEKSIKAVKAEQGSILLVTKQEQNPLKTLIRQLDRSSRLMTYKIGAHITGWVLKHQQPLKIDNLLTDSRFYTTGEESSAIHSVLCLPVQFAGNMIGILTVTNKKGSESFTDADLRLLTIIATQAGQLIRNSQLQQDVLEKQRLSQELVLARKMQLDLIPKNDPQMDGIEIASYYHPAEQVGGDYYDYFKLGENQLGIVQADVSGHGSPASLIMTMSKGMIHSILQKFVSPALVLQEMNMGLHQIAPPNIFVTMVFLVYDAEKKVIRFSNAGHNPPIIYFKKSKSSQLLELPGCALNCSNRMVYSEREVALHSGDVLLIYTDGIIEEINKTNQMFGHQGLIRTLEDVTDKPAYLIIDHIKSRFNQFTANIKQADDIALIVLKAR